MGGRMRSHFVIREWPLSSAKRVSDLQATVSTSWGLCRAGVREAEGCIQDQQLCTM